MKQFFKLIVLMLIGLALNGCYNAQEKEAIEVCKRSCNYPLTFEVIETSSTSCDNGDYEFEVTFSAQNAFGVPCQHSRIFLITNDDQVLGKFEDEVKEYLNNFKSNFKLKN